MTNPFTQHPHQIGETYFEHLKFATLFGINMLIGGCSCIIHAIFPFLFQNTGSNILIKMTHEMVARSPHVENRFICLSETIQKKAGHQ